MNRLQLYNQLFLKIQLPKIHLLTKWLILALGLSLCVFVLGSCSTFARKESNGVIIARRAQVRSSTAVVAADLTEVLRGDVVDILESTEVENGERWLRVRLSNAEGTEGWIEERNVMTQALLDRAHQLADEDKDVTAQATGQLRANTNLRFSPDRTNSDNILLKLESGTNFEIVGWKRVQKAKSSEGIETDDVPKNGSGQRSATKSKSASDEAKDSEEATDIWYKVRLRPSESPAPTGWIYGKQVELTVPSDIIFYRTGREFVAWHRLDESDGAIQSAPRGKDDGVDAQPGNWVILEKSSSAESNKLAAPDYDRIFVLGYDKSRREHYTAYRSPDIAGRLPLKVNFSGDSKMFTVRAEEGDQVREIRFKVSRDPRGLLKIEPLDVLPKFDRNR